jgi:hypothetical protein
LINEPHASRQISQQLIKCVLLSGNGSRPVETAVLQIVLDGSFDGNAIGVCFVRQVFNGQAELLRLPGDRGGLCSPCRSPLRIVLNPLIFPGAVADANKVGAILGRFRAAAYGERSIPPACPSDLLPIVDSLNCHPVSSLQGAARPYNCHKKFSIV